MKQLRLQFSAPGKERVWLWVRASALYAGGTDLLEKSLVERFGAAVVFRYVTSSVRRLWISRGCEDYEPVSPAANF